jgi:pimeloyl-ACP methyl ester carboxylesterase
MKSPGCHLVRFETEDSIDLAGLLYEPRRKTGRAVIFLHGTGGSSVFSSRRTNALAEVFLDRRIAFFPFNNRGAHLVMKPGLGGGSSHERLRECIYDVDAAVGVLRRAGYRDITIAGHSTGANKIAVYDHYKKRKTIRRYVFLAGGDDTGMLYEQLGARRFRSTLERARKLRSSREVAPRSLSPFLMSWRALHDMINPDGDYNIFPFLEASGRVRLSRRPLFRHLKRVEKPSLFVYGENDQYIDDVSEAVKLLTQGVGPKTNFEFVIMKDADHGFGRHETELGTLIADWITS